MNRRLFWTTATCVFALLATIGAVAAIAGPDGLELVSWVAGTASLVVSFLTLLIAMWSKPSPHREPNHPRGTTTIVRQNGEVTGSGTLMQAGRDARSRRLRG